MSSWQCKKRYGDSFSSHGTLCAGSPPDTSLLRGDSCQGNSGGGLVCQGESGRWVLTGVVAGGYGCSDPSSPALYTRVSRFRSWIEEVTDTRAHPGDLPRVDNDLTHTHGEGKDEYFSVHDKQTNEINDITHTHAHHSHTKQHAHTRRVGDTNAQIPV